MANEIAKGCAVVLTPEYLVRRDVKSNANIVDVLSARLGTVACNIDLKRTRASRHAALREHSQPTLNIANGLEICTKSSGNGVCPQGTARREYRRLRAHDMHDRL